MRRQKRSLISLHAAAMASRMPVLRYFLYVGGVLLGLFFILDAYLPRLPMPFVVHDHLPIIRIHSDRKWPERVVYDTNLPTIVPAPAATTMASIPAPPVVADVSAKARTLQAFAELKPSEPKKPEPKPQHKRRIGRGRIAP